MNTNRIPRMPVSVDRNCVGSSVGRFPHQGYYCLIVPFSTFPSCLKPPLAVSFDHGCVGYDEQTAHAAANICRSWTEMRVAAYLVLSFSVAFLPELQDHLLNLAFRVLMQQN
eukprot:6203221-Pleurochrysis_carterae.AAC.4